jgi:endonuclease YncB( thermonuclease family)
MGRLLSRGTAALALAAAALLTAASPAGAQPPTVLRGQVTHVEDGDTLTITIGSDRYPIRLADIDAPETCHVKRDLACRKAGQPLGDEAQRTLAEMALGKQVVARCRGASFNRTVCYVEAQGTDLSTALARLGLAWWEPRYGKSAAVRAASDKARAARMGVWSSGKHVPPWVWRAQCWDGGLCSNAAAPVASSFGRF